MRITYIRTKEWYKKKKIDSTILPLVKILHRHGFDTTNSCGHFLFPYVSIVWREHIKLADIYQLLIDTGYKSFIISERWDFVDKFTHKKKKHKFISINFYPKPPLIKESDIRCNRSK